jgi:iron complex outermembrane recepter protein
LRFNSAQIELRDEIGTALNGAHAYNLLNPAVGFTYKILPSVTAYAGYSETNRAPAPAELSCADPQAPCSLTNFFVGNPSFEQVVAHTIEVGLRGIQPIGAGRVTWNFDLFRTKSDDDILFVSSETVGRASAPHAGKGSRPACAPSLCQLRSDRRNLPNRFRAQQ